MIPETYCQFFQALEANNNQPWFDKHRNHYKTGVRSPFLKLTAELLRLLKKHIPDISENPGHALFRINRDLRFAKDKSPYHLRMKAAFAPAGKKQTAPAYYLAISADQLVMGGGLVRINSQNLQRIRRHIATNPKVLSEIANAPDFIQYFGVLKGEQSKRLHMEFQDIQAGYPYIANKQFYAMQKISLNPHLCSEALPSFIMRRFEVVSPLVNYLKNALP